MHVLAHHARHAGARGGTPGRWLDQGPAQGAGAEEVGFRCVYVCPCGMRMHGCGPLILYGSLSCPRISVKSLTDKTNVPMLAQEITEKCKLIHPSKVRGAPLANAQSSPLVAQAQLTPAPPGSQSIPQVGQVEDLLYSLQQRIGGGAAKRSSDSNGRAPPPTNGAGPPKSFRTSGEEPRDG
jgi:hypothetical protein